MELFIDSSDNLKTIVKLDGVKIVERYTSPRKQRVLEVIEKALKKKKADLEEIKSVKVKLGQGSFTGLRVACTIANTLGWLLKIPINDRKVGRFVTPDYIRG